MKKSYFNNPRPGIKDLWNSFMVKGASFSSNDIPYCPTSNIIPNKIITWSTAKEIYKHNIRIKNSTFHENSFVCFYEDDGNFDGKQKGIWCNYNYALKIIKHFDGIITPDFSTYQDFPIPIKLYQTYRMRAFGYWMYKNDIPVINNVRWGSEESYNYCFDGIPKNSIVSIGTCGGSPQSIENRTRFNNGFEKMISVLSPHTILVYGSSNYPCFEQLKNSGIKIITYKSETNQYYQTKGDR